MKESGEVLGKVRQKEIET